MSEAALYKTIKMLGSRKKLAQALGISIKIVNNWFTRDKRIRLEHALAIEIITADSAYKSSQAKISAEIIAPYAKKILIHYRRLVIKEFLTQQHLLLNKEKQDA